MNVNEETKFNDEEESIVRLLNEEKNKLEKRHSGKTQESIDFWYSKEPRSFNGESDNAILAKNTYSVTYRMKSISDGSLYAVKTVDVNEAKSSGIIIEQLAKEAEILQSICHPNINRYFVSFYTEKEKFFNVVMELIEGNDMAKKIMDRGIAIQRKRFWLAQTMQAVNYLRVHHRGVKQEHVIIIPGDKERVKLVDLDYTFDVMPSSSKGFDAKLENIVVNEPKTVEHFSSKSDQLSTQSSKYIEKPKNFISTYLIQASLICIMGVIILKIPSSFSNTNIHKQTEYVKPILKTVKMILNQTYRPDSVLNSISDPSFSVDVGINPFQPNQELNIFQLNSTEESSNVQNAEIINIIENKHLTLAISLAPCCLMLFLLLIDAFLTLFNFIFNSKPPEELFAIGNDYFLGTNGKIEDETEALRYYLKAAKQGYANAQFAVGNSFEKGCGVLKNEIEAVKYYKLAAESKHQSALYNLALCYESGRGVEKNLSKAVECFRIVANEGNVKAQFNVGAYYFNGRGVEKDMIEAIKYYKMAADRGHVIAQFDLGTFYYNGQGVEKDEVQAVTYYKLAADQGFALAQKCLGNCFENGCGVQKNLFKAVECYKRAADQGNASGQFSLALCYENGQGIIKDLNKAFDLYMLSARQGIVEAKTNLGNCYYYGRGVKRDWVKAAEFYTMAADEGDKDAQFNLGVCYENGEGVVRSQSQAQKYFQLASEQAMEF